MSFHQNGLTLTLFARDYTVKQVGSFTNLFFTLPSMLAVIGAIAGLVMLLYKNMKSNVKDHRRNIISGFFLVNHVFYLRI